MKKINLPTIELREPERLWLETLYEDILSGENPNYKSIRAKLFNRLPINFDPRKLDNRLIQNNGEYITLIGILAIDNEGKIIDNSNKVINAIKADLIKNPEKESFSASELSKLLNISEFEIGLIFRLISPYGKFWSSAGSNSNSYGLNTIEFKENEVFDQYLNFTSIEELINKYITEEKESTESNPFVNFSSQSSRNSFKNSKELLYQKELEITIKPIFHTKIDKVDPGLCFVLMPFTEPWSSRVYKSFIRENIESMGIQCLRADNLNGPIIIEDIWTKINQAAFIIADVTNKNPNVMYEMGIVHTLGKPAIIITQSVENIPFDFKHLRHYQYEDNVEGLPNFSERLKNAISQIYKDNYPNYQLN